MLFLWPLDRDWRQYVGNRVWLSSDSRHPDGCWSEFAWRFSASRSDDGGWRASVYRCRLGAVGCLLGLFYEVGVWLVTWWYGYVDIHDRLREIKWVIAIYPLVILVSNIN